jgi:hypothetical protein
MIAMLTLVMLNNDSTVPMGICEVFLGSKIGSFDAKNLHKGKFTLIILW